MLEYSPQESDLLNPYNIDVEIKDEQMVSKDKPGKTRIWFYEKLDSIDGKEIYDCEIYLHDSAFKNTTYFTNVFKHEFAHTLGLGDAYLNPNATTDTIMQDIQILPRLHLSTSDVAALDAMYRSTKNIHTEDEINSFIASYESTNIHTANHVIAKQIGQNIKNVSLSNFKSWAEGDLYENEEFLSFLNNLSSLENFDTNFGKEITQFVPLDKSLNIMHGNLNHFKVSPNNLTITALSKNYFETKQTEAEIETVAMDGVVFAPQIWAALIKQGEYVFYLNISNVNKFSYKATISHCVTRCTNLSAQQFFEAEMEKENSIKQQKSKENQEKSKNLIASEIIL